jgi:hypothetical protein
LSADPKLVEAIRSVPLTEADGMVGLGHLTGGYYSAAYDLSADAVW